MDYFLVNVLVAMGISSGTGAPASYVPYGTSERYIIELDVRSIKKTITHKDYLVKSRFRLRLKEQVVIPGKKKLGSYYIEEFSTDCNAWHLTIDEMRLHADDGEILAASKDLGVVEDPNEPNSFVTHLMSLSCGKPSQIALNSVQTQ